MKTMKLMVLAALCALVLGASPAQALADGAPAKHAPVLGDGTGVGFLLLSVEGDGTGVGFRR